MNARLIIQGRGKWAYTFPFGQMPRIRIGRGPQNDVDLGDLHASSRHAEIVKDNNAYLIRDVGSRNGTFVQGEKITEVVLNEGDEIRVGRTRMRFHTEIDDSLPIIDTSGKHEAEASDPVKTLAPVMDRLNELESSLDNKKSQDSQLGVAQAVRDLRIELTEAQAAIQRINMVNDFQRLIAQPDLGPLQRIETALEFICMRVHAENGFIMQIDQQSGGWQVLGRYGGIQDWEPEENEKNEDDTGEEKTDPEDEMPLSLTVVQKTIESGAPVITNSPLDDSRFAGAESLYALGIQMCMCMPLFRQRLPAGALYVDCRTNVEGFSAEDQKGFQALGTQLNRLLYPAEPIRPSVGS